MNCEGVRSLLSAYIDGELSDGELLRVDQHLRRCHWCAAEVDALRQTIALVTSLDEVEPPATFHARLHQRLMAAPAPAASAHRSAQRRARRPAFGRWAIPAAAAAALVIGAAGLNRLMPPSPVTPAQQPGAVAGLPGDQGPLDEVPGTAVPPDTSGEADQPGSESSPEVQTPSGTGGHSDPTHEEPPVHQPGDVPPEAGDPADPDVPVNVPGEEEPGNQDVPLGPTSPGRGVTTVTVAGEPGEPSGLPSRQLQKASLEVEVADPQRAAEDLKRLLTLAKEIREEKRASVVELQVTVAAEHFTQAVKQVEEQFRGQNAGAELDPVELNGQLHEMEQLIASLEAERAELEMRLEGETDPKTLEVGALALANFDEEIAAQQASYQNLLESLENGEIRIILKQGPLQ